MTAPEQLFLDLTPAGAVSVGDRVRVLATTSSWSGLAHLIGREGVVVAVRPPCPPDGSHGTWLPVLVLLDGDQPGREYAFEHDGVEPVAPAEVTQ